LLAPRAALKDSTLPDDTQDTLLRPYPRRDLAQKFQALERHAKPLSGEEGPADAPVFSHRRTSPTAGSRTSSKPIPQRRAGPRRMRVLAAEDNRTNQLVFSRMVRDLDIELRFAGNGEEAVEAFHEFRPDLIFMDISMPKMDGKEATRAIRAAEKATGRHVPIIALTAHAMDGDDVLILDAGLDHYMTKPLRKPEIVERILRHAHPDSLPPMPARTDQAEV
jgi:CheY-like chemotaxis protein